MTSWVTSAEVGHHRTGRQGGETTAARQTERGQYQARTKEPCNEEREQQQASGGSLYLVVRSGMTPGRHCCWPPHSSVHLEAPTAQSRALRPAKRTWPDPALTGWLAREQAVSSLSSHCSSGAREGASAAHAGPASQRVSASSMKMSCQGNALCMLPTRQRWSCSSDCASTSVAQQAERFQRKNEQFEASSAAVTCSARMTMPAATVVRAAPSARPNSSPGPAAPDVRGCCRS